jgi:hypothetical protein
MEKDDYKTDVVFLKEPYGGVFAYFPDENYNEDLYGDKVKVCYHHIGQHGSCDVEYAIDCELAAEEEYKDLKEELETIGYNLNVLERL